MDRGTDTNGYALAMSKTEEAPTMTKAIGTAKQNANIGATVKHRIVTTAV